MGSGENGVLVAGIGTENEVGAAVKDLAEQVSIPRVGRLSIGGCWQVKRKILKLCGLEVVECARQHTVSVDLAEPTLHPLTEMGEWV